ncbi:ABC transporter permease subunit [Labedella endophytica]|uniref:ABC transporter permease n=1 Tax=Labedella endophytica TaxID=1523160 RepID=A0A3S0V8R9_9MICO|nr:ABC transporter permease subunit [Labedella endophytica]RUQ98140.1 ABC transporter permease [Labedella endophytica]
MSTATSLSTTNRNDLSHLGIIQSEWIKLRSLRSTWWTFAILFVITVGVGIQMSSSTSFAWLDGGLSQTGMQAAGVNAVIIGTDINVLVVSVLGVLVIASEYSTGMIRSTFTTVPQRVPALLAKSLVLAIGTFLVVALAVAITIPISIGLLAGNGIDVRLDDPHYWRAMIGSICYLVLIGLMAFGIGAILRSIAGGIAVALGLVFVAPLALGLVGGSSAPQIWLQNFVALLPFNLGRALTAHPGYADFASPGVPLQRPEGLWVLEPWQGALGLVMWVVVVFTAAIVLLKRRDA